MKTCDGQLLGNYCLACRNRPIGVCGMDDFFIGQKMANYKGLLVPVADSSEKKLPQAVKILHHSHNEQQSILGSS